MKLYSQIIFIGLISSIALGLATVFSGCAHVQKEVPIERPEKDERAPSAKSAEIVIWGDAKLKDSNDKLLASRKTVIENSLKAKGWKASIATEDMSKSPGALEKFLKTEGFRIRQSFNATAHDFPKEGVAVVILVERH
jgi:hypothetical protein